MTHPRGSAIRLGVPYYPEQWPRERWPVDAAMMADAGISLVRMSEFAWARLEPSPGTYDFAWLDEAIDVMAARGIDVVLSTPTATPPAWLIEREPSILPVRGYGRVHPFGHRRHYCPNNAAYHDATRVVVAALGKRYGADERVIAWQIDNEFGGRCYCGDCRAAFQGWLESRYHSLEQLNDRWGTAFWSQRYDAWSQIPLPEAGPVPLPEGFLFASPSPAHALEYRRFMSDSYVRYQRAQIEELRGHTGRPITHNLMGFHFPDIDYHRLAEDLDFVSWDNYPLLDRSGAEPWVKPALDADAMRGLKDAPVWVMEQQVGPLGWETIRSPRRGQVRLYAWQAIAHGAEVVSFFRWRSARYGAEQHWYGVLDHDGRPNRRLRELTALADEIETVADVLAETVPATDAAIIYDYDSRFALEIQPTNPVLMHSRTVLDHYAALKRNGIDLDVIETKAKLDRYRLVVAPSLYLVDPSLAESLRAFVEGGGLLVLGPRTGFKDRDNAVPEGPLPAWLDELAGVQVGEISSRLDDEPVRIAAVDGGASGLFHGWSEEVVAKGAKPLYVYDEGDFAGGPAVTLHPVGSGFVVYIGGVAAAGTLVELYARLAREAGVRTLDLPEGVEAVRLRRGNDTDVLVLMNFAADERSVTLEGEHEERLRGTAAGKSIVLPPYGVALLEQVIAGVAG